MLLTAQNPAHRCYQVWHVPSAKRLERVLWVDTDTAEVGQFLYPYTIVGNVMQTTTTRFRKVQVVGKVVLVDPIEDGESLDVPAETEIAA